MLKTEKHTPGRAVVVLTRDRITTEHYQEEVEDFFEVPCDTIPNFRTHTFPFRMDDMLEVQKKKNCKVKRLSIIIK